MGINIWELFPKKEIKISDLKGKVLAVDASPVIYQFLASIRQRDGTLLMDSKGEITSHLMGLSTRITKLMSEGLKLIFCFDGRPPDLKIHEREEREYRKRIAEKKLKQAQKEGDIESMLKYSKQTIRLNDKIISESKELLKALGIPVIQAVSEAEAQCAFIAEQGDAWGVVSQDADTLLFRAPRLIRNLTISQRKRLPSGSVIQTKPELIELQQTLKQLKINQDRLIALGILVGSVDHNEPTIIKNRGIIQVNPIGECPISSHLEVPCFDKKTKKIVFKRVKGFIKHKINEPLYEITTVYNRKVKVTKSHSLFIKNSDNNITVVKTTDLKKGDKLVIPFKIPFQNKKIDKINLAQELWKHRDKIKRLTYCDGKNIQKIIKDRLSIKKSRLFNKRYILTKFGLKRLKELRINKEVTTMKTPLSSNTLYGWENGLISPTETKFKEYLNFLGSNLKEFNINNNCIKRIRNSVFEENISPRMNYKNKYRQTILFKTLSKKEVKLLSQKDFIYGRTRDTNQVSSILKITSELMRIIGYFLAEGHLNGNYRINFSFALPSIGHDDFCVNDTVYCIKKVFNIKPKVYHEKSTRHICLDNCVIHDFFAYVLELEKQGSKNKKIPSLIFNVSQKFQLEFLKGLFLGDGSIDKNHISFNTASYDMAIGLSYIFLQQGIISSTSFQNRKNNNMKLLHVCGKNQITNIKKIWEKHNKAKRLIDYCKRPLKQKQIIDIEGDLGYVKIKSIVKVKPFNSEVYDFSVDGENFIAGFGGVCCHNTDYNIGGVRKIGPKIGLKLVQQNKDLDKIFEEVKAEFDWKQIYNTFISMPVTKDYQLKWNPIDEDKIKEILIEKHDFNKERVEKTLQNLSTRDKKQSSLSDWS
ncbi:MAG: LAGLIDADG family homing endonuclease [archaeon]